MPVSALQGTLCGRGGNGSRSCCRREERGEERVGRRCEWLARNQRGMGSNDTIGTDADFQPAPISGKGDPAKIERHRE